jgi:hypothetical protein
MLTSLKTGEFTPTSKNKMANQYVFFYTWFHLSLLSACALSVSGVTDYITALLMSVRSENFSHIKDKYTGDLEG